MARRPTELAVIAFIPALQVGCALRAGVQPCVDRVRAAKAGLGQGRVGHLGDHIDPGSR